MTGSAPFEVVRHPRARRAKLSVDPVTGHVRLTLPRRAALAPALDWAESQSDWIARQRARLTQATPFVAGAVIPFGDGTLTIDWQERAPRTPRVEGGRLVCGGPLDGLGRRVERWLRQEALRRLSAETAACAMRAGVTVSRVAVGDPRARWGSCTSTGAIRYSWRLVLAPDFVLRATVAHEVAHRLHMNHSPAFHQAARALLGEDPAPARAWLRANGAALHRVGLYS